MSRVINGRGIVSSRRKGFTLIELLIVVVIIGILAVIAIPKFATTKGSSAMAIQKGDLRNLATAQEGYYGDNNVYYSGPVPAAALIYNPSQGVAITITAGNNAGWAATSAYTSLTTRTCAFYQGTASPPAPASVEGVVACN